MKLNRSLAISQKLQECKMGNIIGVLEKEFPSKTIERELVQYSGRDRVFTIRNTLLTMVLAAVQQDKSLKNSVLLYDMLHRENYEHAKKDLKERVAKEKRQDQLSDKRKVGRPKNYAERLPKSLGKDISLNTAAFSKARGRVPLDLVNKLFEESRLKSPSNNYSHWHGYKVMIADGTYLQLQDTESIRKEFEVKYKGEGHPGYPQGLLEAVIDRGTGQIYSFRLSNRHKSELELFYEMIDDLPPDTLLLADDLYNCFEIISKCKGKGVEFVFPSKRHRNYEVVEVIEEGDEIIRIKTPKKRSKWLKNNEKANSFLIRQIRCKSPDDNDYTLHTSILNKNLSKEEIQMLYLTRWDIEISILEVKTIMDINILRARTPEMALKELIVSLATYNLIRKVIYASTQSLPFSPKEDFIQKFYTINKNILVDKKGRVYSRWSPGRKRTGKPNNEINLTEKKT